MNNGLKIYVKKNTKFVWNEQWAEFLSGLSSHLNNLIPY